MFSRISVEMSRLRACLQLMRFPAVFSAMSNIVVGFVMVHGATLKHDGCVLSFCLLLLTSSCLYLAGMVFNDVFDKDIDTIERPNRPIPSGRVPFRVAVGIGSAFVAIGLTAASFVGIPAMLIALLLTAATFAYNASLKKTSFGPVSMAACRFLNVLLGSSAIADFNNVWAAPQVNVAAALGVYIVGLTQFAKSEADTSNMRPLVVATLIINAGLCGLLFLGINADFGVGGAAPRIRVASAWFVVVMVIDRYLTQALFNPSPAVVQNAVKTMIMWMIPLDATMVYATTGDALLAGGTALLLAPSLLIGRWLYVT